MSVRVRKSVLRLAAYVPGEQPRDGRYVKLNTNECPYPPSPGVRKALKSLDVDLLRLYPDPVSITDGEIAPLPQRVGVWSKELREVVVRGFWRWRIE